MGIDKFSAAEKSLGELTAQLDQVVNQSMTGRSTETGQEQEFEKDDTHHHRDSGITSGTPNADLDRLQKQLHNERETARSLHAERDALKAALDEEIKAKEAVEARLASASSENEHLKRELDQADARIAETYDALKVVTF